MLGRLGGEEFAVVLPGATAASAVAAAERIREAIAAVDVRVDNGDRIPVTASLGVAVLEGDKMMETAEGLLHAADEALYAAKAGGRNRVVEAASCREDAPVRAVG